MSVTIRGEPARVKFMVGEITRDPADKPKLVIFLTIGGGHRVTGFGITLPLKEYTPAGLKEQIEKVGGREWDSILAKQEKETARMWDYTRRQEAAQEIARKVSETTGIELLEDEPNPATLSHQSFTSGPEVTKHLAELRGKEKPEGG